MHSEASVMNEDERAGYEAEAQQLRVELKKWETSWALEHNGAKPGRDDIKRNSDIAQKYRTYNRVRDVLSGKLSAAEATRKDAKERQQREDAAARKRKRATAEYPLDMQTPSKRPRAETTPRKAAPTNMVTPSISRRLFSPVVPTSIGPTPQRDGRVLGLFDVLDEDDDESGDSGVLGILGLGATPSKKSTRATTDAALAFSPLAATPRKQTLGLTAIDGEFETSYRLGRTPMSASRRNLLDRFAGVTASKTTASTTAAMSSTTTPLKSRDANAQQPLQTPSKDMQQQFATPSFLRRAPEVAPVDENGQVLSPPTKLRLPRKPLVRGLSSMLASLRKMESDRLDQELDILRELEADNDGAPSVNKPAQPRPVAVDPPQGRTNITTSTTVAVGAAATDATVEAQDRPAGSLHNGPPSPALKELNGRRLLGGFDDEGLYDSEPEEQKGRDGQPLRVFKKKGQKRTTRLVHMRPTRTKRPAPGTLGENDEDAAEDVVAETQFDASAAERPEDGLLSDWEYGSEEEEAKAAKANKARPRKAKDKTDKAEEARPRKAKDKMDKTEEASGPVKKAVRKVNELAHANFKRLKLRNTGSKGGAGFNSRFRRRR